MIKILPQSIHKIEGTTYFLAEGEERLLGVKSSAGQPEGFNDLRGINVEGCFYALTSENAAALRQHFSWLSPVPLGMELSFGFGDRIGLATPGHIQALRSATGVRPGSPAFAPIFAQQSVRENTRTGRSPQQVMDDAMWGVFQEGWHDGWGADADHLKHESDLPTFVQAGYTFFTVDPGDHVNIAAETAELSDLQEMVKTLPWDALDSTPEGMSRHYMGQSIILRDECSVFPTTAMQLHFDEMTLLRAAAKYGNAIAHINRMYQSLAALKPDGFDFEVSVDETEAPTSVPEHYFIASELQRLGVRLTSLAPRFPGRFEKGVDYIGDLAYLETQLAQHAAVMCSLGGYKLSLHSGSDKFSVYPLFARLANNSVHVKTAGTSYLEALRVAARLDPAQFRQILALARERYPVERLTYHVSADESRLPLPNVIPDPVLPALLDDFHVRQALHVSFGTALAHYGDRLKALLIANPDEYASCLTSHFRRHLEPFLGR